MIPGILSYYLHSILTFLGAFEEATYRRKKVFQVGRRVRAAPEVGSLRKNFGSFQNLRPAHLLISPFLGFQGTFLRFSPPVLWLGTRIFQNALRNDSRASFSPGRVSPVVRDTGGRGLPRRYLCAYLVVDNDFRFSLRLPATSSRRFRRPTPRQPRETTKTAPRESLLSR